MVPTNPNPMMTDMAEQPTVMAPQADNAILPGTPSVPDIPQVPSLVQSMSQATQTANKINATQKPGGTDAGDWARAINAGVQTALAGAGNIGTVPKGAGALYGVEKTMQGMAEEQRKNVAQRMAQEQQQQENDFKKQELGMEQQKLQDQEKYDSLQSALAQAKNTRDIALFNRQMSQADLNDDATRLKMQGSKLDILGKFQQQSQYLNDHDAKPFQIAGVDVPEFDTTDEAEKFAMEHKDALLGNHDWYPTLDPSTGKIKLYDIKSDTQDWPITYADGTKGSFHGTQAQALGIQDDVYKMEHDKALAQETQTEAADKAQKLHQDMASSEAYQKYVESGYDISKLDAKSRGSLFTFVKGIYDEDWNAYNKAQASGDADAASQAMQGINQITPVVNQFLGIGQKPSGATNNGAPQAQPAAGTPAAEAAKVKQQQQQAQQQKAQQKQDGMDSYLVDQYENYGDNLQAAAQAGGVLFAPKNYDQITPVLQQHKDWTPAQKADFIRQVNGEGGGAQQAGGTVKMKAPDGSIRLVPAAQVQAAQAAGGVVVQ